MAELADALDSGSSEHNRSCKFKSCYPHSINLSNIVFLCDIWEIFLSYQNGKGAKREQFIKFVIILFFDSPSLLIFYINAEREKAFLLQ